MQKVKTLKILAIALISASILQSCMNPEGEKSKTKDAQDVEKGEGITYTVDSDKSSVKWLGTKPGGEHHGFVPVTAGELTINGNNITGGNFTMDISRVSVKDIEDSDLNKKLVNHLKSPDFFNTDTFPTANFEITDVQKLDKKSTQNNINLSHKISGNLTIKEHSKNISFKARVNNMDNKIEAKTPQFLIDRTKWDVNYGSKKVFDDLKDNFIHDEIGLTIKLHAVKK